MQNERSIHLRYDVTLEKRALIMSYLFFFSWPFNSQWTFASSKVGSLTVRFFTVTGQSACRPTPNLEDQSTLFIPPGVG